MAGNHRLKMIRQVENAECALACIAMIADYYGHSVEIATLRQAHAVSSRGTSFAEIINIADALGLMSRPLRLDLDELAQLKLPAILHWGFNHYVVLKSIGRKGAVVHDPALGIQQVTWEEVNAKFTGAALEFEKGNGFQPQKAQPEISIRKLIGPIAGLKQSLTQIFALALALECLNLVMPQFSRIIVDQVIADGDRDLFAVAVIGFSGILLAQVVISGFRSWTMIWVNSHLNLTWTTSVFRHLMKLPQDYFLRRHLGDVASRFSAINAIQQTLTTQFISVILDGLMAIASLGFLFYFNAKLTLAVLIAVVLYAFSRYLYFGVLSASNIQSLTIQAKQQSSFLESVRGIETLRAYNKTAMQSSRYLNLCVDYMNASVKMQRVNYAFGVISTLITGSQRIVVIALAALMAMNGQFTAGLLIAFVSYADMFSSRVCNLVDYLVQLRLMRAQAMRLADIVQTPAEIGYEGRHLGTLPDHGIMLENVGFRYADSEPWVLANISLEIKSGEHVAIVGPSGGGKTTLLKIMMGLLDPTLGKVKVGSIDLKALGKSRFRDISACVLQDDRLFSGSIAENIAFFDPAANMDRVENCARMAAIHDDIIAMPMGYRTLVGDMGNAFSGGQQQRLVLARALYKFPRILFLDEATSHLDMQNEKAIAANLVGLNMTRITVAHRPETIESADRIMLVRDGRVFELQKSSKEAI